MAQRPPVSDWISLTAPLNAVARLDHVYSHVWPTGARCEEGRYGSTDLPLYITGSEFLRPVPRRFLTTQLMEDSNTADYTATLGKPNPAEGRHFTDKLQLLRYIHYNCHILYVVQCFRKYWMCLKMYLRSY